MGLRITRATACVATSVVLAALAATAAAQTTTPSDVGPASLSKGTGDPNLGVANQSGRTLNFDDGWRFKLVNTANATDPSGVYGDSSDPKAAAPDFPDSTWEHVTLPHDWSITQLPSPSQTNATGYFPGGLGWYRKTFMLPASMTGKEITVDFDGVYDNSYVYLNGQLLGNHPYGYTGYSYDITGLAHTDGHTPNVLAVVVQNQEPSSRWYSGSGITRHVHLTVVDPVHIARWGSDVTTPNLATTIQSGYADVHVATQIANDKVRVRRPASPTPSRTRAAERWRTARPTLSPCPRTAPPARSTSKSPIHICGQRPIRRSTRSRPKSSAATSK